MTAQRDSTFFRMLSLRGWVYLAINHDLMRLAQIERLKTYPNFPAAGGACLSREEALSEGGDERNFDE